MPNPVKRKANKEKEPGHNKRPTKKKGMQLIRSRRSLVTPRIRRTMGDRGRRERRQGGSSHQNYWVRNKNQDSYLYSGLELKRYSKSHFILWKGGWRCN